MAAEVQVRISQTTVATAAHLAVALVKERAPGDSGDGRRRAGEMGDERRCDTGDGAGRQETGLGDGPVSGRERRVLDGPKDAALLFILEVRLLGGNFRGGSRLGTWLIPRALWWS